MKKDKRQVNGKKKAQMAKKNKGGARGGRR
jgi:hypothetical protein